MIVIIIMTKVTPTSIVNNKFNCYVVQHLLIVYNRLMMLFNIIKLNLRQIFKFLLLFIYYIFELFFHILVESTNYIQ